MKTLLLASAALLTLGVVSASAADIARRPAMPAKAVPYVEPMYSWTGPYIGINGGGGFGRSDFSAPFPSGSFDTSGGLVGGTLGYNWQANQVVFGLEGDIDWSGIRGSGPCAGTNCETRNDWLATARGRLGYAMGRFMPYITGGAAFGNVKSTIAGIGSSSTTKTGWTLGGGVEYGLGGPWSIKAEYLYVDLGDTGSVLGSSTSFHTNIVRAGLNYRF
jgi:outer membrane immunogenic protein